MQVMVGSVYQHGGVAPKKDEEEEERGKKTQSQQVCVNESREGTCLYSGGWCGEFDNPNFQRPCMIAFHRPRTNNWSNRTVNDTVEVMMRSRCRKPFISESCMLCAEPVCSAPSLRDGNFSSETCKTHTPKPLWSTSELVTGMRPHYQPPHSSCAIQQHGCLLRNGAAAGDMNINNIGDQLYAQLVSHLTFHILNLKILPCFGAVSYVNKMPLSNHGEPWKKNCNHQKKHRPPNLRSPNQVFVSIAEIGWKGGKRESRVDERWLGLG